jgi:transposase InsO family protein
MENPISNQANTTALLRFRVINWLEERVSSGAVLAASLREASSRPWPDEELGDYFAARTIEDWWYAYKNGGFKALAPQARSDAGRSRVIDGSMGARLLALVDKYPNMPVKVWWRHCQLAGEKLAPLSTVYRYLRARGYDRKGIARGKLQTGPTKAFETGRVNELWMIDFSPGPKIRDLESGALLATQLSIIVDDHSRLIPFAFYAPKANTEAFLHTLKEAVVRRGVPVKLYTDQGKPFVCDHARLVCANLGIRLLHARPYHAWSKGKVERLIQTIQRQFEAGLRLDGESAGSIKELNDKLWHWIETHYHQTKHSTIEETPLERYRRAIGTLRQLPADVDIEPLFYTRAVRSVRKDGTVVLGKTLYEVPLHLRGLQVELRYDPFQKQRMEVWHDNRFVKLARQANLMLNSSTGGDLDYER